MSVFLNTDLFICSHCSSFGHWEVFLLLEPASLSHTPIFHVILLFLSTYFLVPQDIPGLFCKFGALFLESAISSRSPGTFYWRIVLETETWVLGELTATGMSLLIDSFS